MHARSMFVNKLREAMTEAEMDAEGFSGHSFRSGAAILQQPPSG